MSFYFDRLSARMILKYFYPFPNGNIWSGKVSKKAVDPNKLMFYVEIYLLLVEYVLKLIFVHK